MTTYDELLLRAVCGEPPTHEDVASLKIPPGSSPETFQRSVLSTFNRILSARGQYARRIASDATARHRASWGPAGPPRPIDRDAEPVSDWAGDNDLPTAPTNGSQRAAPTNGARP